MKSAFQNRCVFLCGLLVLGLSGLSWRLIEIQLVHRQRYAESSRRAFHRIEKLPALRGMIVDRREEPLARSIPVSTVFVDKKHLMDAKLASFGLAFHQASAEAGWNEMKPEDQRRRINSLRGEILDAQTPAAIVEKHLAYAIGVLARPLGLTRTELRERIETSRQTWIPIVKDLPEDVADNLRELVDRNWIHGFEFQNSIKRWYTAPDLAAHLVGFTGEIETTNADGKTEAKVVGRFGIEATMERYLAGRDGWREHCRDARGLVVPGSSSSLMPPRSGLNVQLTIDMSLQAILEEELDAGLAEFESQQGAAILMNPKTGEILAMASRPNFNLNDRLGIAENGFNYAIQTVYEPGSTIKMVAASGAINEGLVTPHTSINCRNGFYQDGAVVLRDDHPAGFLTVEQVLQKSNNIGTYMMGRQLGAKRFYRYLHDFGFGSETGIQLSGESSGTARNTDNAVDFSRACFGYATNVTPLQLACAYSVIGGDGKLRKPAIVRSLVANDGTIIEDFKPEIVGEVLKPKTAEKMRAAMAKVTELGGTAQKAAVPGFKVAGKTGTVRKHNPKGGYYADKYIVSFVGMMPAENPEFVCLVVVDDPRTKKVNRYGGSIAGPIFKNIAIRTAACLNIRPTEPVKPDSSVAASR
ncbi:MAG: penicillin-binding protein 2 [Verrucomicrobiota bacterium]